MRATRGAESGPALLRPSSRAGRRRVPRVLLVGGLEPSGRAGLLADAEAVRARGGAPLVVAAAVTAQGRRTFDWSAVSPALLASQIRALRELGPIDAVKLGMLPGPGQLRALRRALRGVRIPWVVDPVVRASSGQRLSGLGRRDYLGLAGPEVWLTPNAAEVAWLLGVRKIEDALEARRAAEVLEALGFGGVVVKGGHLGGRTVVDVLVREGMAHAFRATRLPRGPEHRGTGCRFASALATELGRGTGARRAVGRARALVRRSLRPVGDARSSAARVR